MSASSRREFLKASVHTAATLAALGTARAAARAAGANERVQVGLIGCGGRGSYLADEFSKVENVEIASVADPDANRLNSALKTYSRSGAKGTKDFREMLQDRSIDAVIVATPDHWHAPAAILACDAGKHVYVEKPCSHNIREGRLLVDAARRNNRIVQHGTQVRSTRMMREAIQRLREGEIGDVLAVKAWNIQLRRSIGHERPTDPPAELDYDLWVGPAPMTPYQSNRVHNGWHWCYDFGTGDMGNDGVHDLDYARWGLGVETHPSRVSAIGGKYFFDDDQQFPDTQQVAFEYPGDGKPGSKRLFIYEQRLWSTNYPYNVDSGVEFYGTKGQMFLSRRGKAQILGERNSRKEIDFPLGDQDAPAHVANFIDAVRNDRRPNGDIEIGHLTATLAHLGNIAVRTGRTLRFDPATERIIGDAEADRLVSRSYREGHWAVPRES